MTQNVRLHYLKTLNAQFHDPKHKNNSKPLSWRSEPECQTAQFHVPPAPLPQPQMSIIRLHNLMTTNKQKITQFNIGPKILDYNDKCSIPQLYA